MTTNQKFIQAALKYQGVPYLFGGKTKAALDCSGLITLALKDVGVSFVHGSANQIAACKQITVDEAWSTPGAMLYRQGHNAISLGDGRSLEAQVAPGVTISPRTETYQGKPRFTHGGLIPGVDYSKGQPMSVRMASPAVGYVSSSYGSRAGGFHAGLDIATNRKPGKVYATFAGTVIKIVRGRKRNQSASVGTVLAAGRSGDGCIIRNADGERQLYGHVDILSSIKVGTKVKAGQHIGTTNLSGITTGYHVHYEEWRKNGTTRDPMVSFNAFKVKPGSSYGQGAAAAKPPASKPSTSKPAAKGDAKVLAYQKRQNKYGKAGLVEDGIDGPITKAWRAWVKTLQRALNKWRAVSPKLVVDGDYAAKTDTAVYQVQSKNPGIFGKADRVVGPKTVKALGIKAKP